MKIPYQPARTVRRWVTYIGTVAASWAAWVSPGQAAPPAYPFKAVTTVGMVTDIVRQVAGDKAEVSGLIGTGVDPHLYKPTRNDVAALQGADCIFYNGLMLEGKMADVLVKVARGGKAVYAVTELLDETTLLEPPEFQGHYDPHVWMDVRAWTKAVAAVGQSLSEFDPANEESYAANARRYQSELAALDEYVRRVIGSIPKRQRVLITAHDAFNYFGRAYDVDVRGIQGISTESEAGLEDINRLVDFIVAQDIPAVFVETSVADKNVRALVEGAATKGKKIRVGGSLFSDAMGPPGTYEGTYVGMIDHNATLIARALGGEAPAKGFQGRLSLPDNPD
jgi:manganese/zinc/iron transport system substrate-binding protein